MRINSIPASVKVLFPRQQKTPEPKSFIRFRNLSNNGDEI